MLRPVRELFPPAESPDLVVGLDSPDDAAVWRLDDSRLLVVTTDFFTPVVDEPYDFGAIAAANSLSDLYAMGARPFLALNVAAMPVDLPTEVVSEILRGGAEKAKEAGAVIAGGHSVQDREPKYGLVALGFAEHDQLMTKDAARPGDVLFLTKPLGTGVTATALKNGKAAPVDVRQATEWMMRLNALASQTAIGLGVRAATDVTGFGLLGHAAEMAAASHTSLRFHLGSIPFFAGAASYARAGFVPGGTRDNEAYFSPRVRFEPSVGEVERKLLFDAQTSGGLLLAVPLRRAHEFAAAAANASLPAWPIGEVVEGENVAVAAGPMEGWERVAAGQAPGVVFHGGRANR